MSGKPADLCLTILKTGGGYLRAGLAWEAEAGVWRVRAWARPGAGRLGVFLPEGRSGTLPERLTLHDQGGTQVGSGWYVPGLRGVIFQVWAWPHMTGEGCWLRLREPEGAARVRVEARRSAGAGGLHPPTKKGRGDAN